MRALWTVCAAAIAAAATVITGLPAAAAVTHATAAQPQPSYTVHRGGMYYDPPVAILGSAADGDVRVLLSDGDKVSVPAADESLVMGAIQRDKSHGGLTADARYHHYEDVVSGDCGSSFIEIADKRPGDHPLTMRTGFDVSIPADAYSWATDTRRSTGFNKPWGAAGGLTDRTYWNGGFRTILDYRHGTYTGRVYGSKSWALLDTGVLCVSGGPVVKGYL